MKQMYTKLIAAAVAIACLAVCSGQSSAFAAEETKKKQVDPQFRHLILDLGKGVTMKLVPVLFNGTPVISNSQILLRSDRFLYCIGK